MPFEYSCLFSVFIPRPNLKTSAQDLLFMLWPNHNRTCPQNVEDNESDRDKDSPARDTILQSALAKTVNPDARRSYCSKIVLRVFLATDSVQRLFLLRFHSTPPIPSLYLLSLYHLFLYLRQSRRSKRASRHVFLFFGTMRQSIGTR